MNNETLKDRLSQLTKLGLVTDNISLEMRNDTGNLILKSPMNSAWALHLFGNHVCARTSIENSMILFTIRPYTRAEEEL